LNPTQKNKQESAERLMDKQRMLVIGARGFLGTYTVRAAQNAGTHQVMRGDRSTLDSEPIAGTEVVEIDIANAASVDHAFTRARPDCVLLLAAVSDIDRCEASPEMAFAINAHGAEHVANACARSNARLLFTSSAAVFDGLQHSYSEDHATSPISVYGKSKLWAEQAIMRLLPSAIVLRFALVLGFTRKRGANAMLDTLIAKWQAGQPVSFSTQEDRNAIDAATLSEIMLRLITDRELSGIYHAGASDTLTRYDLGLRLAARANVSPALVQPQHEAPPARAPRGRHHFLLTDKLQSVCSIKTGSSEQVIERCFA
jgi:dTDP-4-dehydrorhamnose reductase